MDFLFWIKPSFSIGNLTITWYAIFILTGVILALIMGIKEELVALKEVIL